MSEDLLDDVLIAPVVPIRSFKEEVDDVRVIFIQNYSNTVFNIILAASTGDGQWKR